MPLSADLVIPAPSRAATLAQARARLETPARRRAPLWPALLAAFLAAVAGLAAAATVILAAPAVGAPSNAVLAPVSHAAS